MCLEEPRDIRSGYPRLDWSEKIVHFSDQTRPACSSLLQRAGDLAPIWSGICGTRNDFSASGSAVVRLLYRCVSVHFAARVSRIDSKSLSPGIVTPLLRAGWGASAEPSTPMGDDGEPTYGYAWTVGSVAGTETLVQTRPIVRDNVSEFAKDFLRTSSSTAVGMITRRGGPFEKTGEVARFHRWVGVARSSSISLADDAARTDFEARFARELPDFLQRARSSSSASEWGLFLVLAELHAMERLSSLPARPDEIRAAIARTLEKIAPSSIETTDLLISDGATVAGSLSNPTLVHAVDASLDPPASSMIMTAEASAINGLPDEGFMLRTAPPAQVWSLHTDDPACLETSA